VAFASNSILCRLALGRHLIDPAAFTAVRIATGALALALLGWPERGRRRNASTAVQRTTRAGWRSGLFLFAYAIAFSFAYVTLTASTGALILFAAVQATIITGAIAGGIRLHASEWWGLVVAMGGLVYLTMPGLSAPPVAGCVLMLSAGVAWGLYTLRGRGSSAPLADTARNFLCALPAVVIAAAIDHRHLHASPAGIAYAGASGARPLGTARRDGAALRSHHRRARGRGFSFRTHQCEADHIYCVDPRRHRGGRRAAFSLSRFRSCRITNTE
jgi:drug/metabolite transporter (DMT)-like permease